MIVAVKTPGLDELHVRVEVLAEVMLVGFIVHDSPAEVETARLTVPVKP
jgi:hypothetical protein